MTQPVFIVGSGRSGSELIARLLSQYDDVRSHHEYQVHRVQPLVCKHQMKLLPEQEVTREVARIYRTAVAFEDRRLWANSCNKASWIIPHIEKEFRGQAKFIFLQRNGRRVVSSYYYKLADECYADQDVEVLRRWVYGDLDHAPPNEKKYWWPIPPDDFGNYDRFMRICWHWKTITSEIIGQLSDVNSKRVLNIKLEDFVSDWGVFSSLFSFLGLCQRERLFDEAQIPVNVREAVSHKLTAEQEETFEKSCQSLMRHLGYAYDYEVPYAERGSKLEKTFTY